MAKSQGRNAENPEESGNGGAIFDEIRIAGEEYHKALSDIQTMCQKGESDAQFELSKKTQQAHFEKNKADSVAYWQLADVLKELPPEDGVSAHEKNLEYERAATERQLETEKLLAENVKEFEETLLKLREASVEQFKKAHQEQVARIKNIWAMVDPASVDANELQGLAHLVMVTLHHIPQQS